MNIQTEKILLAKLILDTDNPLIIKSIKNIFKQEENLDFWDDPSDFQKEEIDRASLEIEQGKVTEFANFIQKYKSV